MAELSNANFDSRLQYTLRSTIFYKFWLFIQSNDPNEISNVKRNHWKRSNIGRELVILSLAGYKLPVWLTYLALFSRIKYFTWGAHCKKLKLIGNLSDCPQNLTMGRLTYKQLNSVYECFLSKYFFNESDFCTNTPYFLNRILKMFCNFSLKLNLANRRHCFSALGSETVENIKWVKDKIRSDM